jgi:glycosyltransferase involved in cell wall biosynthesis
MNQPLVSVIVPTKNSARFLKACLSSIQAQTYPATELIVVDNNSNDNTTTIARQYTDKVYNYGPERSAQRNFGAKAARGRYLLFIDSDMELSPDIIQDCVGQLLQDPQAKAVILPEESFGEGFWAQCKRLERSFYVGVDWLEAARFFEKTVFDVVGGYDERMVSGEDWDLSQRAERLGTIVRTSKFIKHNEGKLRLVQTLKKKYYYSKKLARYLGSNSSDKTALQTSLIVRYKLYLSQPIRLFRHPVLGLGVLVMKTSEFVIGAIGYAASYLSRPTDMNEANRS